MPNPEEALGVIHISSSCYCGRVRRGQLRLTLECTECGVTFCAHCIGYEEGTGAFKCPICGKLLNINHEEALDDEVLDAEMDEHNDFFADEELDEIEDVDEDDVPDLPLS